MIKRVRSVIASGLGTLLTLLWFPNIHQSADSVLVRNPQLGRYGDPLPAADAAREQWEFAALSENVYQEGRTIARTKRTEFIRSLTHDATMNQALFESACKNETLALPVVGWNKWDFPSKELQHRMLKEGIYAEVFERSISPKTIAVVFEGTNFNEFKDWKANLRWLLRFIPLFEDQYTVAANYLAAEFSRAITLLRVRIESTP
jgi:hypothetical protein